MPPEDTEQLEENFPLKRQNYRSMCLVMLVFMYLIIGAVTFEQLESAKEQTSQRALLERIHHFKQKYPMPDHEFERLYSHMIKTTEYFNDSKWNFFGAFFFCMVSVTLIGYGNNTPQTCLGRLAFLIYLPLGAILSLVSLQSIGRQINELLRRKLKRNKLLFLARLDTVTYIHLIFVETILTVVLILSAAYMFSVNEGWTYFDSIYFSFITLTTIGFGDFVPLKNGSVTYPAYYFGFTLLFITFGLILVASAINLLVVYLANIHRNSLENLKCRMEKKTRMELNNMLIGDVIHAKVLVEEVVEKPTLVTVEDSSSNLCSCSVGFDLSELLAMVNGRKMEQMRKRLMPSTVLTNISAKSTPNCYSFENEEAGRVGWELKRLAIESDFLKYRLVKRRKSV